MKKISLTFTVFCVFSSQVFSQVISAQNGVLDSKPAYTLLKNATIHIDAKNSISNAWILIKGDKIAKVGKDFDVPNFTNVIDATGKHIYPAFVDPYSDYGMPEIKRTRGGGFSETQFNSTKEGAYAWNQAIKPEENAANQFKINTKAAEELRKIGFGAVISHQKDGVIRGNSALIALGTEKENENLLKTDVNANYSLDKGSSTQTYPISLMGHVALLRQNIYDATWYKNGGNASERNLSLEQINKNLSLPSVFFGKTPLDALRADKIGNEFGLKFIIKTNGTDYQRINEIKNLNTHIISTLNFPKALDVEDPIDAELVSLVDLKSWEMAPANLAKLAENKIDFSISVSDLTDKSQFFTNIEKALKFGLSKEALLDALTGKPARALKVENLVGSLKSGLFANVLVTNAELFDPKCKILENWIMGRKFTITDLSLTDINGTYKTSIGTLPYTKFEISGENDKPSLTFIHNDSVKTKTTVLRDKNLLSVNFKKSEKDQDLYRLNAFVDNGNINGQGVNPDGSTFTWTAQFLEKPKTTTKPDSAKKEDILVIGTVTYPFLPFGNAVLPVKEDILIKNATVWTNDKQGKIKADVLIKNGKIESVGQNLSAGSAKLIDGTDKHLTNGIIDEHSHIALFSINDIETVSSEVRQEDAVNSEDTDILRQLAGGVTTSQLLHGSANVIGGQSAIIKLKWGESPQNLIIANSPKFIKFALGENVKRGNSPSAPNRYPSTRMGVEQVLHDAFNRALKYKKEWETYNGFKVKTGLTVPRKDLELDALVEIMEEKRHITCHSYVQSEINMLMQLADSLGFKVNTLTHILEGYKVADKMKARGINASTFSDWWAYKMEVKEAIPYNAAIMTKVGVNVAINSDDAEMARRLNQEAAKTMLYGGLTEEEAWKTVTLNPAKMLHLDDRLGIIDKGKDADLVLWNDNPLSIYAKPLKTIVDGTIYFDADKEEAKQLELRNERNRLIQNLLREKSKGVPTAKPVLRGKGKEIHCDSVLEYDGISVEQLDQFLNSNNK
jgi:imidazolonepropionase-like amidohydrolase